MSTITLSKPITAHGEQIQELTLREPTIKDVRKLGLPYLIHTDGSGGSSVEIRADTILNYASTLAAVPPSSIDQLALADFSPLQAAVMGFFGDMTAADSTNDLST